MPPSGDGYHYFSSHLLFTNGEYGRFDIRINGEVLCTVEVDQEETLTDDGQAACGAATYTMEGKSMI